MSDKPMVSARVAANAIARDINGDLPPDNNVLAVIEDAIEARDAQHAARLAEVEAERDAARAHVDGHHHDLESMKQRLAEVEAERDRLKRKLIATENVSHERKKARGAARAQFRRIVDKDPTLVEAIASMLRNLYGEVHGDDLGPGERAAFVEDATALCGDLAAELTRE